MVGAVATSWNELKCVGGVRLGEGKWACSQQVLADVDVLPAQHTCELKRACLVYSQFNGHVHLKDNFASSSVLLSGREKVSGGTGGCSLCPNPAASGLPQLPLLQERT